MLRLAFVVVFCTAVARERTNHFTVVEVWKSRSAYEAHLMAPHSKPFRDKLQPWLGSPFDERLSDLAP